MDSYQETFNTWNQVAEIYQEKFMDVTIYNDSYDFFLSKIHSSNAKLFEIGCGPGNITRYLLSERPDLKIHGIDVAPNMIELARKNNPSATFAVLDCRDLSGITEGFEGVLCGFCIPFLSEQEVSKLFLDVNRMIQQDDPFYLSFVDGPYENSGFKTGNNGLRVYFHYYPEKKISELLSKTGFRAEKQFSVNYTRPEGTEETHCLFVAQKTT